MPPFFFYSRHHPLALEITINSHGINVMIVAIKANIQEWENGIRTKKGGAVEGENDFTYIYSWLFFTLQCRRIE